MTSEEAALAVAQHHRDNESAVRIACDCLKAEKAALLDWGRVMIRYYILRRANNLDIGRHTGISISKESNICPRRGWQQTRMIKY